MPLNSLLQESRTPRNIEVHKLIFFLEFQLMTSVPNDSSFIIKLRYQSIFWCTRELNPKSFIQLSEILLFKLTGIHIKVYKF